MEESMELKRRLVYDILTTPIIVSEKIKYEDDIKIILKGGVIFSTQLYDGMEDPDMSDFAVGFYEILYKELLEKSGGEAKILNDNRKFVNDDFTGDTMNSFNTMANKVSLGAKWVNGNLQLDPFLVFYKSQYHCLANFWLIPMEHGRKTPKLHNSDSLDLYLNELEDKWGVFKEKGHFKEFKNFDEFKKVHYVDNLKRDDKTIRAWYKQENTGKKLIEWALNNIFARAKATTQDDKMVEALYNYFGEKGLV